MIINIEHERISSGNIWLCYWDKGSSNSKYLIVAIVRAWWRNRKLLKGTPQ